MVKIFLGKLRATQIIMLGFLITILTGALLLMLPVSSADGKWTGFIDSLFTSASAVCITGLAVVNTAEHWSVLGKWIILGLIQIGGLGFMSFVTIVFLAIGKKITMRERNVVQEAFNLNYHKGLISFVKYIFKFTIVTELIGAVLLSIRFIPEYGFLSGIFKGIFHSVSAFCNAGFDILGDTSLREYSSDIIVNAAIMALIIMGGIGFPVVQDIFEFLKKVFVNRFSLNFSIGRLKLQTKIAVLTTAFLIIFGALCIFVFEYKNKMTIGSMGLGEKVVASLFQSVTLRTAGFETISQASMNYSTKLLSVIFMFIGGSPAGTAGGAKTVTVAILIIAVISLVRGDDEINAFNRSIGMDMLQKALSVVIMMIAVIFAAVMVLSFTEEKLLLPNGGGFELLDIVYEVVSATGTVGLSTGVTPLLSPWGKVTITICMYIGRVGPISLAMAMTARKNRSKSVVHYPEGKIIVG